MPATTIGTTGTVFGVSDETNLLVQSFDQTVQTEKAEVKDGSGDTKAVATFNLTASFTLSAYTAGAYTVTAGKTIASLANWIGTYGGVTTGAILVDSVQVTKSNSDFQQITITGTRYPGITVSS